MINHFIYILDIVIATKMKILNYLNIYIMNSLVVAGVLDAIIGPDYKMFMLLHNNHDNNNNNYNDDNRMIILVHLKEFIRARVTNILIIRGIDLWIKNGYLPGIQELSQYWFDRGICDCLFPLSPPNYLNFIKHFIVEYGCFPSCEETKASFIFHEISNRFPIPVELATILSGIDQKESIHAPTQNLSKLTPMEYKACKENNCVVCSICLEEINDGEKCYRLPCNHYFHSVEDKCPGVLNWLKQYDTCPNCRIKIIL